MKKLILTILIILSLTSAIFAQVKAHSNLTSTSYKLSISNLSTCSLHATSPVYQFYASLKDKAALTLSSASFRAKSGFINAAYIAFNPAITRITPSSGYNIAPIKNATIEGINFSSVPTVYLSMTGEANIIATNVAVSASSEITCDLDITGARIGSWDITVKNSSAEYGSLARAFEIKTYTYDTSIVINYPNPFDPARETTSIMYKLTEDANVTVVIFSITAERLWRRDYASGTNGGRYGDNSLTWDGISDFSEMASNGVYLIHVINRSTGKTLARGKIAVIRR